MAVRGRHSVKRTWASMANRSATGAKRSGSSASPTVTASVVNSTRWKNMPSCVSVCCSASTMLPPMSVTKPATAATIPGRSRHDSSRTALRDKRRHASECVSSGFAVAVPS